MLGVVITMQAIGGPPEKVGEKVGEGQYMACIKNALVAFSRGDAPLMCVEFSRRNIDPEMRPSLNGRRFAMNQPRDFGKMGAVLVSAREVIENAPYGGYAQLFEDAAKMRPHTFDVSDFGIQRQDRWVGRDKLWDLASGAIDRAIETPM